MNTGTNVRFQCFPKTQPPPDFVEQIVQVFVRHEEEISTRDVERVSLGSDKTLKIVANGLIEIGFEVEKGKRKGQKIGVPVLYGESGKPELQFEVDAYCKKWECGMEVEGGRTFSGGNAIYRDLSSSYGYVSGDSYGDRSS